jgi:uroporphyrinogen III methyltransferase / synthase
MNSAGRGERTHRGGPEAGEQGDPRYRGAADPKDAAAPLIMSGLPSEQRAGGKVYLVGAGPGDPQLITVRALELIRRADVIVFDALANPILLMEARRDAELVDAGKRARAHTLTQEEINDLLVARAMAGRTVVRLKGGDPYVFGRGSEEAIYLHERGVAVEVVPGVTSAIAAPAYAGVPVTHRGIATTVTLITGHEDPTKPATQVDYQALARLASAGGTLCFYMGMGRLGTIIDALHQYGLSLDTPAAVIQWGTLPTQKSVRGTLRELPAIVDQAGLEAPAIIVIGPVAGVDSAGALRWFEQRPLFGKTILVTRTRHQASDLRVRLEELGAHVLEAPTIEIAPPADWGPIDQAIRCIRDYDWLVLTSVNGVDGLSGRLESMGLDARHLAGVKVAAIGGATAAALRRIGVRPDLVPTQFIAESLASELIAQQDVRGRRFLLLRADIARPALRQKLTEAGAIVQDLCLYETRCPPGLPEDVLSALRRRRVHLITFTSSSTVRNFVDLLGQERPLLEGVTLASIGPITTQTLRDLGLTPNVEATEYDIDGLVAAIRQFVAA